MPTWMALSFQDASSPFMEHITFFHDHTMIVLIMITVLTLYLVISLLTVNKFDKFIMEGQEIETIWTILPSLLLVFIALPSLKNLYLMEDNKMPSMTIKINGHQWYWSYEYNTIDMSETENFMDNSNILRLMKTSEILQLPVNTLIRSLVSSTDVIHSWTVPSMGMKVDALPGRLNQIFLSSKRIGLFVGQCSEICGTNHSFMPITVIFSSVNNFINKISS